MCLDIVIIKLEMLVFFSDLQKKRLKSRKRAAWGRLFKVVQIWRRVLLYSEIFQSIHKLIQCLPEAKALTELNSAVSAGDIECLQSVMRWDLECLLSRSSWSPTVPGRQAKHRLNPNPLNHLSHSSAVYSCLVLLYICRVFVDKHIWCCLPMLNIAFFSQYTFALPCPGANPLGTAMPAVLGHSCVNRLSHNLSAMLPDSSQGCCHYHRSYQQGKVTTNTSCW